MTRGLSAFSLLLAILTAVVPADAGCPGDLNGDNRVTVDDLVMAVSAALDGCPGPAPTVTPGGPRFVDNGDGTITDHRLGLLWEKKSDDGSVHDRDDRYKWTELFQGSEPDGDVFTVFLAGLNSEAFAGYSDWRLPTLEELQGLIDTDRRNPAIYPPFDSTCLPDCAITACSCTAFCVAPPANEECPGYWTSSSWSATGAYIVGFSSEGWTAGQIKSHRYAARAVRDLP